jgi:hypothetical protein
MEPTADSHVNAGEREAKLPRAVRKGLQVAALAAALVPLGSVPVAPTDPVIGSPRAAHAAPGDVHSEVFIPFDLVFECDGPEGSVGSALAMVPGGKAGFPARPALLVTSCPTIVGETETTVPTIFLTDPFAGEDAEVVKRIPTIFPSTASAAQKPSASGWEALALRADKGDILACGRSGTNAATTVLWSIDFSPYNTTADGTATFLRNGPAGSSCASIAWDPSDRTFYQTPAAGFSVLHFKEDGTALPAVVVPLAACNTSITGLGIGGTSLFVACGAVETASVPGPVFAARPRAAPRVTRPGSRDGGHVRVATLDPFGIILTGGPLPPPPPPPTIAQLYKVNGSLVRGPFPGPSGSVILAGVPDDPATLGAVSKELLWTLDDYSGTFVAFEMAGGTIGQRTGPPALNPGSCPGGNVATDGDGLLDCWKDRTRWSDGLPGINYAGTYSAGGNPINRDVTLCVGPTTTQAEKDANCALAGRKDLFVEIDYMDFHRPGTAPGTDLDLVVQMFANAPTPPGPVKLHAQVDDLVNVNGKTHYTNVAFPPCTAPANPADTTTVDFDTVKRQFFGTAAERASVTAATSPKPNALNAKALAFRYALMAHNLLGQGTTSGCAEVGGNDFIVSLGTWATRTFVVGGRSTSHNVGSVEQVSATFAHELGHTLFLRHGGGDNINCKPNYFSIMNYTFQFSTPTSRPLDFSRAELPTLDKTALDETDGVGATAGNTAFGPVPALRKPTVASAVGPVDWNVNSSTADTGLSLDITQTTSATGGCPANQLGNEGNESGQRLFGYNDWANLQFDFRRSVDFADGAHVTAGETLLNPPEGTTPAIQLQTAANLSSDATLIGIDFKPGDPKNNVNRKGDENVEVALLSSASFNALTVAPETVLLQGAGWVLPVNLKKDGDFECKERDVKRPDKKKDLVCKFKIPKDTIQASETEVQIIAATADGDPLVGTASINVRP